MRIPWSSLPQDQVEDGIKVIPIVPNLAPKFPLDNLRIRYDYRVAPTQRDHRINSGLTRIKITRGNNSYSLGIHSQAMD
jgi:hypothetical protein